MAHVYVALVRHGEFARPDGMPSGHLPHPLTARGREQASKGAQRVLDLAAKLGASLDDVIECSTLPRAWETASLLRRELEALSDRPHRLRDDEALLERSMGSAANLTLDEIEATVRADPRGHALPDLPALPDGWRRAPHFRLPLPGAESHMEAGFRVARRLLDAASELRARASDGDARLRVVVGHGGSLRHASVHLGAVPLDRVALISMDYVAPVVLEAPPAGPWKHVLGEWKPRSQPRGGAA